MQIYWSAPDRLWLQVVPLVVLVLWIVAEYLHLRRVVAFGDPKVLGIPLHTAPRIASAILLLITFGSVATLIALPQRSEERRDASQSHVQVLIDSRLSQRDPLLKGFSLEDIQQQILEAATMVPNTYFALYRSGDSAEMIVPPTSDAQGLYILMDRLLLEWQPNPSASLSESVKSLLERSQTERAWRRRLVVFTAQSKEEILLEPDVLSNKKVAVLFVQVSSKGTDRSLTAKTRESTWIRFADQERLRGFLAQEKLPTSNLDCLFRSWSYVQMLAALGLIALLAESMLASFWVCTGEVKNS